MNALLLSLTLILRQVPEVPDAGAAVDAGVAVDVDAGEVAVDGGFELGSAAEPPPWEPVVVSPPPPAPEDRKRSFSSLVTGSGGPDLRRVAGSAHAVTREDLERNEYNDVHRVLQQVPGVYVRDEDGYGLRPNIGLRGASSERSGKVTLMEDGILFGPAPYSAPAAYFFPLVTRMEGAEIYKGPASIRFGPNTIGGAIDLRSRPIPQGMLGGIDLSAGAYRSGKAHAHVGYGGDLFGAMVEGVHLQSGGYKRLDGGGDTGFDKNEALLKARVGRVAGEGLRHRLELKLGYADERSNETYLGLSEEDFRASPLRRYAASQRDHMAWKRTQAQLTHVLEDGGFSWRTTAYRMDFHRIWAKLNRFATRAPGFALKDLLGNAASGRTAVFASVLRGEQDSEGPDQTLLYGTNDRAFISEGVQSAARWEGKLGFLTQAAELGVRYHHDQIERRHTEDPFLMRSGVMVPEGGETQVITANNDFTRATALYLQDEVGLGPLLVVPGIRVEHIETFHINRLDNNSLGRNTSTVPLLGLGAVYQLTRGLSALAGAHQGFSPVSPGQDADVRPERSVNYEGGLRYRSHRLRAEAIGFFNDYTNLTAECTLSSGCEDSQLNRQFNGNAVSVYGLEAVVSQQHRGPWQTEISEDLAYTWTDSQFRSTFVSEAPQFGSVKKGDSLPYVPAHQGSLRLRVGRNPWSVSGSFFYRTPMREQAGSGPIPEKEATDPQFLIDLAAHVAVGEDSELYGTISNLLDAQYLGSRLPYGARPGAPRLFQIGFKHRFQ